MRRVRPSTGSLVVLAVVLAAGAAYFALGLTGGCEDVGETCHPGYRPLVCVLLVLWAADAVTIGWRLTAPRR